MTTDQALEFAIAKLLAIPMSDSDWETAQDALEALFGLRSFLTPRTYGEGYVAGYSAGHHVGRTEETP